MSEVKKDIQQSPNTTNQTSSYRSIFKATSLFGGVQIWRILIQIIKQKAIALLLGASGMGVYGLYMSSVRLIQDLTSMGLDKSAVKNVAEANGTGDMVRVSRVVTALRRLVWFTGILGMVAVIVLSPFLSKSAFGNYDYTIPFVFLSVSLLLQQLSAGQSVLLQGLRKLKQLALANVLGAFFGLLVCIPIYYFFGVNGIVPTLILDAFTTLSLTYYFSRKIKVETTKLSNKEVISEGKGMLGMGLAMSLNGVMITGVAYVINIFIAKFGGTAQVGLYAAGLAIINSYVGMVFNAMSTDYYPRLSGISKDNEKCSVVISQQAEIATLIIAPLACAFIVGATFIIKILYTSEFLDVVPFMQIAMLGMLFKTGSWAISYVFLAKGDVKIFIANEFGIKCFNLPLYLLLYYFLGLKGVGLGYLINYIVYFYLVYIVAHCRYKYRLSNGYLALLGWTLLMMSVVFIIMFVIGRTWLSYSVSVLITITCSWFSLRELDKRLSLKTFLDQKFHL